MVQLSHPYMTTGKTIALTIQTFVNKVMSLLLNMLFKLVIAFHVYISFIQLLSRVRLFVTPWTAARQASLSITNSQCPPKLMSIESVMPSNHLILYHPLLLLHVCVYINIHIHIIHTYTYVKLVYVCVCMCVYMYVCVYIYIYIYVCKNLELSHLDPILTPWSSNSASREYSYLEGKTTSLWR